MKFFTKKAPSMVDNIFHSRWAKCEIWPTIECSFFFIPSCRAPKKRPKTIFFSKILFYFFFWGLFELSINFSFYGQVQLKYLSNRSNKSNLKKDLNSELKNKLKDKLIDNFFLIGLNINKIAKFGGFFGK